MASKDKMNINIVEDDKISRFLKNENYNPQNEKILILPPTKCKACKGAFVCEIDTLQNATIFAQDTIECENNKIEKFRKYSTSNLENTGLSKLYPVLFYFNKGKLTRSVGLFK
jgi:hypothetical protein